MMLIIFILTQRSLLSSVLWSAASLLRFLRNMLSMWLGFFASVIFRDAWRNFWFDALPKSTHFISTFGSAFHAFHFLIKSSSQLWRSFQRSYFVSRCNPKTRGRGMRASERRLGCSCCLRVSEVLSGNGFWRSSSCMSCVLWKDPGGDSSAFSFARCPWVVESNHATEFSTSSSAFSLCYGVPDGHN